MNEPQRTVARVDMPGATKPRWLLIDRAAALSSPPGRRKRRWLAAPRLACVFPRLGKPIFIALAFALGFMPRTAPASLLDHVAANHNRSPIKSIALNTKSALADAGVSALPGTDYFGQALPPGAPIVELPLVLSGGDALLYRRIFSADAAGDNGQSDRLLRAVEDKRLVGTILAERYLAPKAKPDFATLRQWLQTYHDLPEAAFIYQRALKIRAKGDDKKAILVKPAVLDTIEGNGGDVETWRDRGFTAVTSVKLAPTIDQARISSAVASFAGGKTNIAVVLTGPSLRYPGDRPGGAWIAGLTAWQSGRKADAAKFFAAVAESDGASRWTQAAAAFWAARANLALGRPDQAQNWLVRAARFPYCFYGLLASAALGTPASLDWRLPAVRDRDIAILENYPGVMRALALVQIDQRDLAETELRQMYPSLPRHLAASLVTIAEVGGMPRLAMRIAADLQARWGIRYDAALYPVPPWQPPSGFIVNRALIFAIARQESRFDPDATSERGAAGLMQLMPESARTIAHKPVASDQLYQPEANLAMAQRLLVTLLAEPRVQGNLINLAIAYNIGPAVLARWQDEHAKISDPLLALEQLPSSQVRMYVEQVLTSYWIYQTRLGQPQDSLTALANGKLPTYHPELRKVETASLPVSGLN